MSESLNYHKIKLVGPGSWIGEESYFLGMETMPYSVQTDTIVSVLEIGVSDFNDKIPAEMLDYLRGFALQK